MEEHKSSERAIATFIGHSSVLIELGGLNLITDPNFRRFLFTIWRRSKVGLRVKDLPPLNIILISHGHYDHMSLSALKKFPREAVVIIPPGLEKYPRRLGFPDVRVIRWWENTEIKGTKVFAVPARHFSGRSPWHRGSLYQGYIVQGTKTVYFAGDTGFFQEMERLGERFSIDLAFLPIGAYKPWSVFGHHMTPEDAIEAMERLRAKRMVPIHWGAFKLAFESMKEPPERLLRAARKKGVDSRISILKPGEQLYF
ncbi:MAG: MBL fold metallo-hydrolase [Deltaproteobacteria bacterium]|nr:MAG: MBL fold metallo-hydrolase [Deltaproteobacteria bacterium]